MYKRQPYAGPVKMKMDLGVDVLPKFSKDTTDRNRCLLYTSRCV